MKARTLTKSRSQRVEIMGGAGFTIEDLRFRRDLAIRDGDRQHALECAIAIDKRRLGTQTRTKLEGGR